jgi:hypothetical protein
MQETWKRTKKHFIQFLPLTIFLPGLGQDQKRLVPLMARFKAFTKGIYQSDNIKVSKQKKVGKGKRSKHILQHPRPVAYKKS